MPLKTKLWRLLPWIQGMDTSSEKGMVPPGMLRKSENVITDINNSKTKRKGIDKNWDSVTSGTDSIIGLADYWYLSGGTKTRVKVSLDDTGQFRKYDFDDGDATALTDDGLTMSSPTIASMEVINNEVIIATDGSSNRIKKWNATSGNVEDLLNKFEHTISASSSSTTVRSVTLGERPKMELGDYVVVTGMDEVVEVTEVQFVANDTAGDHDGTYFTLNSAKDATEYYVWFDVDAAGNDPAPTGLTGIQVSISANDVINDIASAVQTAINAEADFGASVLTDTVTITNAAAGHTTDAANVDVPGPPVPTVTTNGLTYNGTYATTSINTSTNVIQYTAPGSGATGGGTNGTVNGLAPNGSILRTHQGRLLTTDAARPYRVHYSRTGDHEIWGGYDDSGAMDFTPQDNDPVGVTAIFPTFRGELFIAKSTKLYRVRGVIPFHSIELVSEGIGCVSHESVVTIDQSDVVFVSQRGVHSLAATEKFGDFDDTFISKPIQKSFNDEWTFSRQKYIKARYHASENLIFFAVTESDLGTTNNVLWLYHTALKQWISRWPVSCESVAVAQDADKRRLYIGSATNRVYQAFTSSNADTTEAGASATITMTMLTGIIYPDSNPYVQNGFKNIVMYYTPKKSPVFTVSARVDRFGEQGVSFDQTSGGTPLGTGFELGATLLGSEGLFAPYVRRIDGYGRGVQLTFTEASATSSYSIEGLGIEYQPGGVRHEVRSDADTGS